MLNSEVQVNKALFPKGFRRDFDAHVYYDANSRQLAEAFRNQALTHFQGQPVFVGALIDKNVGPHPTPMFEINFPIERFGDVVFWLLQNRNGLTTLVHQVTGDDPKDHSQGAIWMGTPLKLDESKLDPSPSFTN